MASPLSSSFAPGTSHNNTTNKLKCFTYGCPCCMEAKLSVQLRPLVSTVVLHDDVIARVTPNSIR